MPILLRHRFDVVTGERGRQFVTHVEVHVLSLVVQALLQDASPCAHAAAQLSSISAQVPAQPVASILQSEPQEDPSSGGAELSIGVEASAAGGAASPDFVPCASGAAARLSGALLASPASFSGACASSRVRPVGPESSLARGSKTLAKLFPLPSST